MSNIIARALSSKYFDYNKETKVLCAEISTLEANTEGNIEKIIFSQVYDDACDAGFTMVSRKTFQDVTFYYEDSDTDGEEITGWNFHITPESEKKFPHLKGLRVLIIND